MILQDFKDFCIKSKPDIIVQKLIIESETFFFKEIAKEDEFDFKKDISLSLDIHIRDIVIVGSSKLGFSLKPEEGGNGLYLFNEFDHNYKLNNSNKKSDLDVAIISSSLFDKEIKNLYDHTSFHVTKWNERSSLAKYVLKGRLTTRFLPKDFLLSKAISIVRNRYQMKYEREVNIEIYKSWYFFETYHQENIKNIQINLIR